MFTDPTTKDEIAKQINVAVERMAAYDSLPPEVREGVRCAQTELDTRNIATLLQNGWSKEEGARQLRFVRASDTLLNVSEIGTATNRPRKRT